MSSLFTTLALNEKPSIVHDISNNLAIIYGQVELLQMNNCDNLKERLKNTLKAAEGIKRLLRAGDITGTLKKEYDKSFTLINDRIEYLKEKDFPDEVGMVLRALSDLCNHRQNVHKHVRLTTKRVCFNCLTEVVKHAKEGWLCTNCGKVWGIVGNQTTVIL